ncbi:DNA polymerase I [Truepera radiovictrix DSM 17093]|uniref:DNA polymerase I n=1 Tax=Truepera radiovictrix (strain DSM 17093 / CIP 108686 / LMG 22925 / RQ-24) TaxID=649638 RepID=D7CT14_TRURR|nr:DNA polymerase I [Truepera radiovictrix]ADI15477.1 DNA polymerase I [Truepera radiovictrix DSM 17093]WMT55972.1 DNA polymerase I [Truepera radiovictrix]
MAEAPPDSAQRALGLGATDDPGDARRPTNGHKIVIIDGHALAFRSYYAIRELSNSRGEPTNAIYGFLRSLLRILAEEGEFDATVVTFDAPAKSFRHEQFEGYKAGRRDTPEDLPEQIRIIKQLVDLLGLYRIEVPGLEADDLIGTIAARCAEKGYTVEIVTSDRDAYQLVSDRVYVRGLAKAERFGPDEVFEKFGVRVDQWVDFRALTGDASDNIPGAKGIGPKTAAKLLQDYGSLDAILENLERVKPESAAKKVRASLEDVKFSRELSRIITDADLTVTPEVWAQREPQREALRELLERLEFGSIIRELGLTPAQGGAPEAAARQSYRTARLEDLFFGGSLGFVLSDVSPMTGELLELAVAAGGAVAEVPPERALELLRSEEVLHAADAKALAVYAQRCGLEVRPGDDPLLMAYVLDPSAADPETLTRRYGTPAWGATAVARAVATAELSRTLRPKLAGALRRLYEEIERPVAEVLAHMEVTGVRLDTAALAAQSESLAEKLAALEREVRELAGNPNLNLNSRDQLAELLFEKLELQAGRKTSTGKRSTAVSALEPLKDAHPVVPLILEYRELAKLKSTYLDPLPRLINPHTGRLHTTFNQTATATGRLSSANPNLQNIPVRTAVGREIRRAFVADEGATLLVADYSQIELRILAHITGEEALVETFRRGEDIHRRTAAQIFGVPPEAVTPEGRRVAKVINFGVLYGMSAHRLARELSIPYAEADAFIRSYFEGYPKVRAYIDETLAFARDKGYVETLFGRRRPIPDIRSSNRNAREYAERTAYNMPIQGTQADIVKLAMVRLLPRLKAHGAKLLLQVHDELVLEAPEGAAEAVAAEVKAVMEGAFAMRVPLVAEVGRGRNWLEAK